MRAAWRSPATRPKDFPAILQRLWWPLDKALDKDSVRASALVSLVDAIKHGTTTLIDHHASPNFIDGSLDVIADAVDQAGLRAVLCYEVTDRDGREKAEAGIAENLRFIEASAGSPARARHVRLARQPDARRRDAAPLCRCCTAAAFTSTSPSTKPTRTTACSAPACASSTASTTTAFSAHKTIAAHCVHVDDSELDRLAETGTWITHQPRSNMNNGVGAMAFDTMMARGMNVCLGNDGFSNNMWAEWKAAYLAAQSRPP